MSNALSASDAPPGEAAISNQVGYRMSAEGASAHVLIIAYNFPPDSEVGAQRIARFCRYLPEYGMRPTVITVEDRFRLSNDGTFPVSDRVRVERTKAISNPLEWYGRMKQHFVSQTAEQNGSQPSRNSQAKAGFFRDQIFTALQTPDRYLGWYWPAVRRAEKVLREGKVDAILSTGPPWTAHLIARHLRNRNEIRWVADFRDPWSLSVSGQKSWARSINERMESSCIRGADLVVCNTDRLREYFVKHYSSQPERKFFTITNGFDDVMPATAAATPEPSAPALILHLGGLYAQRRIDTFCEALARLRREGKLDPNSFKVLFLGDSDPSAIACAEQIAPELMQNRLIEFQPPVSWQRGQEVLARASLLLLFQGGHTLQIPAKFYEYLVTGKAVFAVTKQGALTDLIDATGCGVWADPSDPEQIARQFLIALGLRPRTPEEVQQQWAGQFHYRFLTQRLAAAIRSLLPAKVAAG